MFSDGISAALWPGPPCSHVHGWLARAGVLWPHSPGRVEGNFYFHSEPFLTLRSNDIQDPALMHH